MLRWTRKRREEPARPVEEAKPDYRDGRFFDPLAVGDGMPRMLLTWVTNDEGQSGFSVDTFNMATKDILDFYAGAATAVATHALRMREMTRADADAVSQTAE